MRIFAMSKIPAGNHFHGGYGRDRFMMILCGARRHCGKFVDISTIIQKITVKPHFMIPLSITIKNNELPDSPGVYFYYDNNGVLLYIGKATSLKKRVSSYFNKAHNARIADLVSKISSIAYQETGTVIEALVLEANSVHALQPPYNVMLKDDKSFLYLCITKEEFPRPLLLRGYDLEQLGIQPFQKTLSPLAKKYFLAVFGPYMSGRALKTALDLVRPAIPWSVCTPPGGSMFPIAMFSGQKAYGFRMGKGKGKPCFDAQIGRCPGVCTGTIARADYLKIIKRLLHFFSGQKMTVVRELKTAMNMAAKAQRFEEAARLRNQLFSLEHVRDVALILKDETDMPELPLAKSDHIQPLRRVEAYDIAHLSGTSVVASMVVFEGGKPQKSAYRKFRIRTQQNDDVAAMREVLTRRIARAKSDPVGWSLPEVFVIDGGETQVNAVCNILDEQGISTPVVGIAKGFDRKQDRLVYSQGNQELRRIATEFKPLFQQARDEAHRFAGVYHRVLRRKRSLGD